MNSAHLKYKVLKQIEIAGLKFSEGNSLFGAQYSCFINVAML
jgi:hypothetical protein